MSVFPIDGGLDYVTDALYAQPGTLTECMNFERALEKGMRRIDGIVSFDGFEAKPSLEWTISFWVYDTSSLTGYPSGFPGGDINLAILESEYLDIQMADGKSARFFIEEHLDNGMLDDDVYFIIRGYVDVPSTIVASPPWIIAPSYQLPKDAAQTLTAINLSASSSLASAATIAEENAAKVCEVPGRTDSDVHFTHLYQDNVYVARDYEALIVRGSDAQLNLTVSNGDWVTNGEEYAQVVNVYGSFAYGSDTRIVLKAEHGKIVVGDTLYAVGRGSFEDPWGSGGYSVPFGVANLGLVLTEVGAVTEATDETEAGLFHSIPTGGWTEVDQMREVRFRLGQAAMADLRGILRNSSISNAEADSLIAAEADKFGSGTNLAFFTSASAVSADDATYTSTSAEPSSNVVASLCAMKVSGFDFSAIPLNATIVGVQVEIQRKSTGLSSTKWVHDCDIGLIGVGVRRDRVVGTIDTMSIDNKGNLDERWAATDVTKVYGSPSDTWGQPITADKIRSPDFGVLIGVERSFNTATAQYDAVAEIDYVKVSVHYLNATSKVYFYNAAGSPTDVSADIVAIQLITGAYSDNDAEGVLTLKCGTDASNGRRVGAGDQIRSAVAGGGTLYATASANLIPVTLPSQSELDAADSQYRATSQNFYGSEQFEAMYCVNGAGPAFMVDQTAMVRIHIDLPEGINKPRHVGRQGEMLVLAIKSGSAFFSVVGEPLSFRGVDGAVELAFGSQVTGLLSLPNDVLGVFCKKSIFALRGLIPADFAKTTIAANIGAIEYTVVDMGTPVFMTSFGVSTLSTTAAFGDFQEGGISEPIWPWLQPRVQALTSDDDLRIRCAYAVRNKNQYRIVFRDGQAVTMRYFGEGNRPQFTRHCWQYNNGSANKVFVPRHVSSDIDSRGVERIFATMQYSARWNLTGQQFVYAVDKLWYFVFWSGTEFVANPIQAYFVTNWAAEKPSVEQHFDKFFVFGRSRFPVTFQASRAVNYSLTQDASGDVSPQVDVIFGATGEQVPEQQYNRSCVAHLPVLGYNVAIRFDTDAANTPPFSISAIKLDSVPSGNSRGHRTT